MRHTHETCGVASSHSEAHTHKSTYCTLFRSLFTASHPATPTTRLCGLLDTGGLRLAGSQRCNRGTVVRGLSVCHGAANGSHSRQSTAAAVRGARLGTAWGCSVLGLARSGCRPQPSRKRLHTRWLVITPPGRTRARHRAQRPAAAWARAEGSHAAPAVSAAGVSGEWWSWLRAASSHG